MNPFLLFRSHSRALSDPRLGFRLTSTAKYALRLRAFLPPNTSEGLQTIRPDRTHVHYGRFGLQPGYSAERLIINPS